MLEKIKAKIEDNQEWLLLGAFSALTMFAYYEYVANQVNKGAVRQLVLCAEDLGHADEMTEQLRKHVY